MNHFRNSRHHHQQLGGHSEHCVNARRSIMASIRSRTGAIMIENRRINYNIGIIVRHVQQYDIVHLIVINEFECF